jgi:hypothetical protein
MVLTFIILQEGRELLMVFSSELMANYKGGRAEGRKGRRAEGQKAWSLVLCLWPIALNYPLLSYTSPHSLYLPSNGKHR